jgi:hypothetical protein
VAKFAIAQQILLAENESELGTTALSDAETARRVVGSLRDCWLHYLMRHLRSDLHRRKVEELFGDVAFIVFNYDRCVEQYLYWAFQMAGDLSPGAAANHLKNIPIIHTYGSLGPLPYDKRSPQAVGFGAEHLLSARVANRIKTYTEEKHDQEEMEKVHQLVLHAKKLVFLGFGYHEQNLNLLFPNGLVPRTCRVWGTAVGASEPRKQALQHLFLSSEVKTGPRLEDCGCAQLLSRFHDEILG